MTTSDLSGNDLREAVFAMIHRELGPDALVRFIAENLAQPGHDYTLERQGAPDESISEIAARIEGLKAARGASLAPPGAQLLSKSVSPRPGDRRAG